jgi:hypothetical protein
VTNERAAESSNGIDEGWHREGVAALDGVGALPDADVFHLVVPQACGAAPDQRSVPKRDQPGERIVTRMAAHEQILRSAAEFLAKDSVLPTRQEWHRYVDALDLDRLSPGVQGLAYAEWIPSSELDAHVRRIRAEGFPDYEVHPGGPLPAAEGYTSSASTTPMAIVLVMAVCAPLRGR